ncbi:MAG: DUF2339 domain-containing protein [Blastocatellales bacterium]
MAANEIPPDQFAQLNERLSYLEQVFSQQIARIYAIEQRLGMVPPPVKYTPPPDPAMAEKPPQYRAPTPAATETYQPEPERTAKPLKPEHSVQPSHKPVIPEASAPEFKDFTKAGKSAASSSWFSLEGKDLEALIGGNWFSRIGIFAIILSVGFFLKLAFENQWIGATGRVMIGVVAGISMLFGGERMRAKNYRYYAHGLSGGGIAILYLTLFAAFARYHLIGQMPAFVLMSLVTATAVLLAARYDALAIAILGLIGGFLTPILLSTGKDNQVGLFSYITLLNLGVLALAYFKQWRFLNFLTFIATVLMSAAWADEWYAPEKLWTTIFFFTLLFAIFALLAIFHNVLNRKPVEWPEILLILVNAGFYFSACYGLLESGYYSYLGLFAVLVSAFYLGLGYLTYSRDREDKYLILTFLGLASLFLTLAVPIQLNQHWVTMAWAIEGVILTWIGLRADHRGTRFSAVVVFVIAVFHWLMIDLGEFAFRGQSNFTPLFNRRAISCIALIACLAGAAWLYRRYGEKVAEQEKLVLAGSFALAANALAVLWLSLDLRDYFEQAKAPLRLLVDDEPWQWDAISKLDSIKHMLLTLLWCVYGSALLWFGFAKRLQPLRRSALLLLGLAGFKVLLFDAQYYAAPWRTLILNPVFASYAIMVATLAASYWRYLRSEANEIKERDSILMALQAGANLLALIGLSLEINGHFTARQRGDERYLRTSLTSTKQFVLTALWSIYGASILAIGVKSAKRWLRIGALGLLALTIFKVLIIDLWDSVYGRTPLFNQTFAAFMIIVAALAYAYWLYSNASGLEENLRSRITRLLLISANLLAVFALSTESDSYFSAAMGPLDFGSESWREANLSRQLWLSVIWAVYSGGMLAVGLWRRNRLLRLMALSLLGLTILKVFLVDLSSLDKIYRVISFVVLGVILLAVSFLYQRSQQRMAGGNNEG